MPDTTTQRHSLYEDFTREQWARLRASTPLMLSEAEIADLRGLNERFPLQEVVDVYLPLSRLLNLHVAATRDLHRTSDRFLGRTRPRVPYILGIAGSVAVGKSTSARVLQALLARWPDHARVDLVVTDGFLHPNADLEARGLMSRKGFPESYDVRRLVRFLSDVKSGRGRVPVPVYSHILYDVVPGRVQLVDRPDILIVEGLNILQDRPSTVAAPANVFVSDFFDFSIYLDADPAHIEEWYVERFLALRRTAFRDPASFFHRYAGLEADEGRDVARGIWREINGVNLVENIEPTRARASLVLEKGRDHAVERVRLRTF